MKILITGGAGFIGSHLVDALIKRKHKLIVVDNLSSGLKENLNPKAKFYYLDIRSKKLDNVFQKERPEIVFHCAAQINLRKSIAHPLKDARINILGSLNLLENCRKYKIKKFIFSSTGGAIYGDTKNIPTPEDFPANPPSPYGIAKLTIEKYLHYYYQVFGLPYFSLRYSNVYGPRQNPKNEAGVIAIFSEKILKGEQIVINGDGRQTRDYVYIDDVVRANLLALRRKGVGVFNIGTEKETSVREIFKMLKKITQTKIKAIYGPPIKGEQRRSCLAIKKAKRELGWSPKVRLDDGLKKTVQWFKKKIK